MIANRDFAARERSGRRLRFGGVSTLEVLGPGHLADKPLETRLIELLHHPLVELNVYRLRTGDDLVVEILVLAEACR